MSTTTVVSTINQRIQVGVESTPGTAVAATRELLALSIAFGAKAETLKFRPQGRKFNTIVVPNKEWSEGKLAGVATFNELVYPLACVLNYAAPEQQGATAAYKWMFAPSASERDTVKTLTVEQGSVERAQRVVRGTIPEFGIAFSREGLELSGSMFGSAMEDDVQMSTNEKQTITVSGGTPTSGSFRLTFSGQQTATIAYDATAATVQAALEALSNIAVGDVICTGGPLPGTGVVVEFKGTYRQTDVALMTATDTFDLGDIAIAETVKGAAPTALDLVPILPETIDVYVADTHADLDTAEALTGVYKAEFAIGNRFSPVFLLRSGYGRGFGKVTETAPDATLAIEQEADEEGLAWLETLQAGAKKHIRIEAVGDVIEDAYTYLFRLDMCVSVDEPGEFGEAEGLKTSPFNLVAVSDPDWDNKALEITLVNELTSL
jgi:hypothetical protein